MEHFKRDLNCNDPLQNNKNNCCIQVENVIIMLQKA